MEFLNICQLQPQTLIEEFVNANTNVNSTQGFGTRNGPIAR